MEKKELEPAKFEAQTSDVLQQTLTNLAEGITGLLSSSRQDLTISIGHIFQRMRGGQFLSTFLKEWNEYREKGRIKEDYQFSEQHKACLQEMLDFLDKDIPDETRFGLMKQVFLVGATEAVSDRDSHLPLQFMKIARSLSSGEVLILGAAHYIAKTPDLWGEAKKGHAAVWLQQIAEQSGLKYPELVEAHEDNLVEKHLLTKRMHADRSGVSVKPHFRLTGLGYNFCEYVDNYKAEVS